MNPKTKIISFYNRHGDKLSGVITYPSELGLKSLAPAIVLCQGLSGVKDLVLPEVAKAFAKEGWISLAFDYSGFGESHGDRGWIDPFLRIDDAWCAGLFLANDPYVNKAKMGVYGLSYGGPVAISLLSRMSFIKAAVAVSAPGNGRLLMRQMRNLGQWEEFLHHVEEARKSGILTGNWPKTDIFNLFPFSKSFMEKYSRLGDHPQSSAVKSNDPQKEQGFFWNSADLIMAFQPEEEVKKKGKIPLLLILGEKDDVATPAQVKELEKNAPHPRELHFLPGLDHVDLDCGEGLEKQIRMSISWFKKYFEIG